MSRTSPKVGLGSGRESPLSGTNSPNRLRRPFLRDPPITRVKRIEHYVKFPLLAVDFVNKTETVIVAGGGGPGQHGIGNGMVRKHNVCVYVFNQNIIFVFY